MIIDSSALLAILLEETEAETFLRLILKSHVRAMSAGNLLEAAIVADGRVSIRAGEKLDRFLAKADIEIISITLTQVQLARQAYRTYGRGNHPARLNFGDCFAYALAQETGRTLLFKGVDFAQTDVRAAI